MDRTQQHLDEELSACIDGELERSRRQFVLKRLSDETEVAERWGRYHLVRAVMRKEQVATEDLSSKVSAALASDQALTSLKDQPGWLRPVAGGLIAASVAVVALMGLNQNLMDMSLDDASSSGLGFVSQSTPMDRIFAQPAIPVSYQGDEAQDTQLRRLLFQHQQAARQAGVGSYWPVETIPSPEDQLPPEQQEPELLESKKVP